MNGSNARKFDSPGFSPINLVFGRLFDFDARDAATDLNCKRVEKGLVFLTEVHVLAEGSHPGSMDPNMTIGVDERCAVDEEPSIVTVAQKVVARRVQALGKRSSVGVRGQFEIETGEWASSIAAQAQHAQ